MTAIYYRKNQTSELTCEQLDSNWDAVTERQNHTGTQLASTISNLYTTVEGYDFITALQTCCEELTTQLTELIDSIFGDGEITELITNLKNELLQNIAEVQTDLNVLALKVTTTENNIATINTTFTSLTNSINGLANSKANIANPTFTGVPKAPTPVTGAESNQIVTVGYVNNVANEIIESIPPSVPIGSVIPYSGASISDPNYVLANGQAISRTDYAAYFTLVGVIYGAGNGISTFNVPNLQQRIPVGVGNVYTLGAIGGAATHTLTTNEMPSHNHNVNDPGHTHSVNDPGHFHGTYNDPPGYPEGNGGYQPGGAGGEPNALYKTQISATYVSVNGNYTGISFSNNGGSEPHNNMQPYIVLNYIVKVK